MSGRCKLGVTKTATMDWFGIIHVWLNENEIANLISIPTLEADGCGVLLAYTGEYILHTLT